MENKKVNTCDDCVHFKKNNVNGYACFSVATNAEDKKQGLIKACQFFRDVFEVKEVSAQEVFLLVSKASDSELKELAQSVGSLEITESTKQLYYDKIEEETKRRVSIGLDAIYGKEDVKVIVESKSKISEKPNRQKEANLLSSDALQELGQVSFNLSKKPKIADGVGIGNQRTNQQSIKANLTFETKRANLLAESIKLTEGSRAKTHGDYKNGMLIFTKYVNVYLTEALGIGEVKLKPSHASMLAHLLKLSRTELGTFNPDDAIDGAVYLAGWAELREEELKSNG